MKRVLAAALMAIGAMALTAMPGYVLAQDFPNREVKMVVPFPPGAVTDGAARILQPALAEELGQPVIVENLPGAGGTVGVGQVARGEADGYTFFLAINAPIVMAPYLYANLPYDPVKDIRSIGFFAETYLVLAVKADSELQTVEDIVAAAKERPGELSFGSAGIGSAHQISGELLNKNAGIEINHIPFQGGGPAIESLLGGHIDMSYGTLAAVLPHVQSGALRIIAAAQPERIPAFPDIPIINETVEGVETSTWIGLFTPKGVPDDVIQRLSDALAATMAREDVVRNLSNVGVAPYVKSASEADEIIVTDLEFWREAIGIAGIEPQ